jgi:FtsP/CotA-like multicopper oxidase with cupredoxin domain
MHLHGHHFVVYDAAGDPLPGLRDTVLVDSNQRLTVGLVADNPGRWMIHCHMLEHQASGMETWFEVLI